MKYAVEYTWKETCYVVASSKRAAENLADNIGTDPSELELIHTKVRPASLVEETAILWPEEEG